VVLLLLLGSELDDLLGRTPPDSDEDWDVAVGKGSTTPTDVMLLGTMVLVKVSVTKLTETSTLGMAVVTPAMANSSLHRADAPCRLQEKMKGSGKAADERRV